MAKEEDKRRREQREKEPREHMAKPAGLYRNEKLGEGRPVSRGLGGRGGNRRVEPQPRSHPGG